MSLEIEPTPLWSYFFGLCAIPRPSGAEGPAARWVADQARALGCEVEQDEVGNVLIRKPATPGREDRPAVALQCHVDMVCEKNEDTPHDFARDPIVPRRVGDWVYATGTTLGADDGIGVATALAILASDAPHPALEVLVTVDEESGLTGANHLRPGWMRAPRLLNLDSEEDGEVTIGCAGGVDTTARRRVTDVPAPAGVPLRVKVSGLKGGHSGVDIELGRANSLRLLGGVLEVATSTHGAAVASAQGGNKRNALPREASALLVCPEASVDALRADVTRLATEARLAFGAFDPGIDITVDPSSVPVPLVLSDADTTALVGLLLAGPHGVEAMSPDIRGLVQTSTNLGLLERVGDVVEVNFLTRSSVDSSKRALSRRIHAIAARLGFEAEDSGDYPGWRPVPGAAIVADVQAAHQELFGRPMVVKAIHAGLECGVIGEKYPGMEMASIGPTILDAHTPEERVSIPSVAAFWRLFVHLLGRM